MPEQVTQAQARAVLDALRAQYPIDADEFTLLPDFDGREWTIIGEMAMPDWPFEPIENIPEGVHVEAVNHLSVGIYPS